MLVRISNKVGGGKYYSVWCPGCSDIHMVDNTWDFNGDEANPTLTPSVKVTYRHPKGHSNDNPAPAGYDGPYEEEVCHSFIRDGFWDFLSDSTHQLAGQKVRMVSMPEWSMPS